MRLHGLALMLLVACAPGLERETSAPKGPEQSLIEELARYGAVYTVNPDRFCEEWAVDVKQLQTRPSDVLLKQRWTAYDDNLRRGAAAQRTIELTMTTTAANEVLVTFGAETRSLGDRKAVAQSLCPTSEILTRVSKTHYPGRGFALFFSRRSCEKSLDSPSRIVSCH